MNKKIKISSSVKKFAMLGAATIVTLYGAQALSVEGYNNFIESTHDEQMVNLYNNIWKNIDKKDMSTEIIEYKKLANKVPKEVKMGIFMPEITDNNVLITKNLPNAENVEMSARDLNKKTKIGY